MRNILQDILLLAVCKRRVGSLDFIRLLGFGLSLPRRLFWRLRGGCSPECGADKDCVDMEKPCALSEKIQQTFFDLLCVQFNPWTARIGYLLNRHQYSSLDNITVGVIRMDYRIRGRRV